MSLLPSTSLRARLLWMAALPAGLLAAALAAFFISQGSREIDSALRERSLAIASFLAPAAEYGVVSGSAQTLQDLISAAAQQPDMASAIIFDSQGNPMAARGNGRLVALETLRSVTQPTVLATSPDRLAVAAPVRSVPIIVDDLEITDAYLRLPGAPEMEDTVGWVYLEIDTETQQAFKREQIIMSLSLTLLSFLLAAVIGARMARSIAKPISRLAQAVDRVAAGEPSVSVKSLATTTEVRLLEHGFNMMARSIDDAHRTLQHKIDEATTKLAHQAMHDPLTDLPNRRAFEQALEEAVSASQRNTDRNALCVVDLDRFKHVNDTGGHAAGDALLLEVAKLLRERLRTQDLVCRIGGDEFALIFRNCSLDNAAQIAEQIRASITALRFEWEDQVFTIGASIGLIGIDPQTDSPSDLMVAADLACYTAKRGGRNKVVTVRPEQADAPAG